VLQLGTLNSPIAVPCSYSLSAQECFLIPYDMQRVYQVNGVYINPKVVAAYVHFHITREDFIDEIERAPHRYVGDHHVWFGTIHRHWAVRWWIHTVEYGREIQGGIWMDGNPRDAYLWDGGACTVFDINTRPLHDYNATTPTRRLHGSDSFGLPGVRGAPIEL
jgi:hypothetical protein